MKLQERIKLMLKLGDYLTVNDLEWQEAKQTASLNNSWFTAEFIDLAAKNIVDNYLQDTILQNWVAHYHLDDNIQPKNVGIVMAGNIPMVGFHDFLSVFISGHRQTIKLSSKDDILLKFIIQKLIEWEPLLAASIVISSLLNGCDAYIATGSNNSAAHFEQYFAKFPNIIRSNKTSVAIIEGNETQAHLEKLSDDIHQYFGLGCRNVTKLFVPEGYDFVPLIRSFDKYSYFMDRTKFKNNYDYQLSILLLNNVYYMTNGNTLLVESQVNFTPISVLNYEYYKPGINLEVLKKNNSDIQCVVGNNSVPFGMAQNPDIFSYADGVDTMQFLLSL